jgi:hypothetical protein
MNGFTDRDVLQAAVRRGERSADPGEVREAFTAAEILWTSGVRSQGICRTCRRSWIGVQCRCVYEKSSDADGRGAAAPASDPRASWGERLAAADNVQLRSIRFPSPFRILMRSAKRRSMAFAARLFTDPQVERGGVLIGSEDPDGITLIDHTDDMRGMLHRGELEFGPAERRARELRARIVGTWHTHDGVDAADAQPSRPTDLRSLAGVILAYGLERGAALVLTRDRERGWERPVFNSYIARVDDARTVVEPAAIGEFA